jgi:sulfite exporter TauE/SafE
MIIEIFISALALGVLSSFHCVGMCGAIAFSLPTHYLSPAKKLSGIVLYNIGRIATYSALGLSFGLIGRQISMGGFQKVFSIVAGVVILAIVIQHAAGKRFLHVKAIDQFNYKLQIFIGNYIKKQQLYGMFVLGAANGLLPCGMVYLAVTGAMASGSINNGFIFMASFGLGTLPAMFLLGYFGFMISFSTRNFFKKAIPYFVAAMGVLLILRGMNIGLPVNPNTSTSSRQTISCH